MSWNGLSFAAAAELAGRERSGAAIGFQQTILSATATAVPPVFAALVGATSWRTAFALVALAPLLGSAMLSGGQGRGDRTRTMMSAMRVSERLDELYAVCGPTRPGYSHEEDAAHELAAAWMREAGLEVDRDGAGNLFGRRGAARIWSGSHLDSVPNGGRFDGVLGVVAAIEAAERLPDAELAVVAFRAEETGPMGSRRLSELPDAFVELHIEQGSVLERLGEPLGVVTGISGQARGAKTFEGRAAHAGTTPMEERVRRARRGGALHPPRRAVRRRRLACDGRGRRDRPRRDERRPGPCDCVDRRACARRRRRSSA
jgi:hypothetical protein